MKDERCFAMSKAGKCRALTVKGCPGYGDCPFYKPIWKHREDLNEAIHRLHTLPEDEQARIAEKYYRGRLPRGGVNA